MVYKPRTVDEVYLSLRDGLTGRIARLTNFVESSFNYVWTRAFSNRFRDNEVAVLATQLSGWIDYAGGPVTQEQLDTLGIDTVTPEEVNEYMDDEDLDNLVELVGVTRGDGEIAEGTVTFTTVDGFTEIPEETPVGTQPDTDGNFFEYQTLKKVETESGKTEVSVGVEAVSIGEGFNVGAGQVNYLINPPTGVQGVVNNEAITGGDDVETNEELRSRAKNAIFDKSGGGTSRGVEGYVESETDDVASVSVAEYPGGNATLASDSPSPGGPGDASSTTPFADVIVEGGQPEDIQTSIDEARPVSIQHNFVRPTLIEVDVDIQVEGGNIDTTDVEASVEKYINGLGLGETIYRDKIIQRAMNADSSIDNITDLTISISNELLTFTSGTTLYVLNKGEQMKTDGITEVTGTLNGSNTTFAEDTDYQESDSTGDGTDDSIDWGLSGDTPDDGTDFFVTYTVIEDIPVQKYEKGGASSITVSEV